MFVQIISTWVQIAQLKNPQKCVDNAVVLQILSLFTQGLWFNESISKKKLSVFVLYIDINIIWTCISYLPRAFMVFTIINNYVHYFHNKFDDMFEFLLLFYFSLRILPFKLISFERLMIIKYTRISFV